MGWLFSTRRDPDNPRQLQIAVHELEHAWAWHGGGLDVRGVEHTGDDGTCHVRYYPRPDQIRAFAIGCWAGFRRYARGSGICESAARRETEKRVRQHWSRIERAAKRLHARGRLAHV